MLLKKWPDTLGNHENFDFQGFSKIIKIEPLENQDLPPK